MSYKKIIEIKGMHCRSCEILLEDSIGSIEGIKKVRTNYKKGIAEIEYDREPRYSELDSAVRKAGYTIGKEDKKHFFSRNPADYFELSMVAAFLLMAYMLLDIFGVFTLAPSVGNTPGLVGVLLVGLTAGISTCMALIGGLVLGMSSRHAELHPEATPLQKFRPHIFFNIGRLVSYVVLGGFIGLLGSAFTLSSSVLGILTIILGIVMLFMGLKLIEIFPRLHNKGLVLPKSISRLLGLSTDTKEYSHWGTFVTGALTFFVPCGFTQAMQLYAVSTGSFTQGALIMGMFALGTLPGIIGIGGLTSAIKGSFARYFFKFAGLVVIFLAIFNITSGYNLTGFTFGGSRLSTAPVVVEEGKQVITMVQSGNGYSPRQFTIKKGIPVVWKIQSTSRYTCAAFISMPALRISRPLQLGQNTIEFTPTQTGELRFSCSMGMYTGSFNVID